MRPIPTARRALAAGALALPFALAGTASATDGNLYLVPPLSAVADPGYTATQTGGVYGITAPRTDQAIGGRGWTATWAPCPPGTEIASVQWHALRYHDPVAPGDVLSVGLGGTTLWSAWEADVPRSPGADAPGKGYQVAFPAGACAPVTLSIHQSLTAPAPQRAWTFYEPTIALRDLAPPTLTLAPPKVEAALGAVADATWIRDDSQDIVWSADDNMGAEGIGEQRILLDGSVVWRGTPGSGLHAVPIDLRIVPDGAHRVEVQADGDGTAGAQPLGADLLVDRTPPRVSLDADRVGDRVRVQVTADDGTGSGLAGWKVTVGSPDGPAIATGVRSQASLVDLGPFTVLDPDVNLFLVAVDHAGNGAGAHVLVARPDTPAWTPPAPEPAWTPPISTTPAPLGRVVATGLSARRGRTSGRRLVVRPHRGGAVVLRGSFRNTDGSALDAADVLLRDPAGRRVKLAMTDESGAFTVAFRPRTPGTWSVTALAAPPLTQRFAIRFRASARRQGGAAR
jgi:hypothetical protein